VTEIRTKRVYEPVAPDDGFRVLVDRLWPRGLSKEEARLDLWAKEVAPSTGLRQWFGHEPEKWVEFQTRYEAELKERPAAVEPLLAMAARGRLTLLFGARETRYNQAIALRHQLEKRIAERDGDG
jgi:uncharacterized protein YeaO (DUF488 family)